MVVLERHGMTSERNEDIYDRELCKNCHNSNFDFDCSDH